MSVKYLLGSTGIENRVSQSILLSMERAEKSRLPRGLMHFKSL